MFLLTRPGLFLPVCGYVCTERGAESAAGAWHLSKQPTSAIISTLGVVALGSFTVMRPAFSPVVFRCRLGSFYPANLAHGSSPSATGAASATAASVFPSQGKSGDSNSLGWSGLGVGKYRDRELALSPAPGDQPQKDAGGGTVTVGTSNGENVIETRKRTMSFEEEEDEEDDLKPRFLWKRRKIS